jgi:Flp pilus assembly protein TadG
MLRSHQNYLKLGRDERGNVAMTFALMLTPLMLVIGGGVDYGIAMHRQEKLQSAADAASLAAASGIGMTSTERTAKANAVFLANLEAGSVPVVQPNVSVSATSVSVSAQAVVNTSVLGAVHVDTLTVKAKSTATTASSAPLITANAQKVCLLALDPNSADGIHVQGTNDVNYTGCWGHTNSTQATAINGTGNAAVVGTGHCAVGGASVSGNNYSPVATTGCATIPDPFATVGAYDLTASYVPAFTPPAIATTCKSQNLSMKKGTYTLDPGRYCGGINMQAQANVTLNPGVYIIDNGLLNVQSGSSISGTNVVLYFSGANARMTIIGGGTVNLKGRNSGSSYEGFLAIAHPDAYRGLASNIQGGGTFNLEGMLYMPTQRIEVSGNGNVNGSSPYFAMVAKDFYFRGNGTFNLKKYAGNTALPDKTPELPAATVTEVHLTE